MQPPRNGNGLVSPSLAFDTGGAGMKTAKMEERMEQRLWSSSSAAMHLPEKNIFPRGVVVSSGDER